MNKDEIKEIVKQMTLEEKASLASGKDFWQSKAVERLGIPSVYFSDGPNGLRKQEAAADHLGLNESVKSTCFPTSVTMASSWDTDVCYKVGEALGKEATALKVGMLLGPGTNIKRSPLCGRNFEYYSEDPYLAGKCAASMIRGIQENAASACVKHFAANNQETGRMYVDSVMDERTLREIYLTPFEIAVKEGKAKAVMSSYNRLNGVYANENEHLLCDILRGEWGFDGVVVTDWGGCNDRVDGYICGNEIEMPGNNGESDEEIVAAVKEGRLSEEILNKNVERFLTFVYDVQEKLAHTDKDNYDQAMHHAIAEDASRGAMVLLKNDGTLPINKEEKVCFIGDFAKNARYQGGGSSHVNPTRLENVIDNITPDDPITFTGYAKGFDQYGKKSKKLVKEAVELLKKSDKCVLFMGLDDVTESEGKDRENMKIPENQLELLAELKKTGKPIAVVLSCGAPVETDWDKDVNALMCVYLTGQAGAQAILDNLMGVTNPCGKLAETFPVKLEDNPSYNYYLKNEMTAEYREGIFVGYRYYDKAGVQPKYPFGHGLSYTTFEYSDLQVTGSGISITLTNTGTRDGAEVVQMYVGTVNSKVFRPVKELKGFKKVYLKAGESKKVIIPFDEYTFRWYNVKTERWEVEDCKYTIYVASSSKDIRLTAEYTAINGIKAETDYSADTLAEYYEGNVKNVSDDAFEELIEREIPDGNVKFIKKKRIKVDRNTPVIHLKYAKGWTGRAFAGVIVFAEKFLRKIGKTATANVLKIGPYYMPVRGISRQSGGMLSIGQVDGLIIMFNGKFFKGLSKFFKEGKIKKNKAKERKKAEESKEGA
ncbi:MAG: glycoside hydrolase family 3 C-terminal domain-containing protein [Clostridia bacterium]|nr:glycoside hydrolase family 3 C-terminal domain-containing protein [Clostridia bacterium]